MLARLLGTPRPLRPARGPAQSAAQARRISRLRDCTVLRQHSTVTGRRVRGKQTPGMQCSKTDVSWVAALECAACAPTAAAAGFRLGACGAGLLSLLCRAGGGRHRCHRLLARLCWSTCSRTQTRNQRTPTLNTTKELTSSGSLLHWHACCMAHPWALGPALQERCPSPLSPPLRSSLPSPCRPPGPVP